MSLAPWILLAESAPEVGQTDPETTAFLTSLFVLMLATFIGLEVIKNVSRLLHTPLMSLTNAISAIAVVGSIVLAGQAGPARRSAPSSVRWPWRASMTNIVSGFILTDRMLKMFKKREPGKS